MLCLDPKEAIAVNNQTIALVSCTLLYTRYEDEHDNYIELKVLTSLCLVMASTQAILTVHYRRKYFFYFQCRGIDISEFSMSNF
jgi:hypothetical protein